MNKAPFQKEEAAQGPGREKTSRPGPCDFLLPAPPKKPLRPHRNGGAGCPYGRGRRAKAAKGILSVRWGASGGLIQLSGFVVGGGDVFENLNMLKVGAVDHIGLAYHGEVFNGQHGDFLFFQLVEADAFGQN